MKAELLRRGLDARAEGRAAVIVRDLGTGLVTLLVDGVAQHGAAGLTPEVLQAVQAQAARGASGIIALDESELFVQVLTPPPRLAIVGAVHVAQILAPMAATAGFAVEVIDPRTALATAERFPGVQLLAEWPQAVFASRPLDRHSYFVTLTHDPKLDEPGLTAALEAGAAYIGALGSLRSRPHRMRKLAEAGLLPDALARIRTPIGIKIGSRGPAEIAVSILAELIAVRRGVA